MNIFTKKPNPRGLIPPDFSFVSLWILFSQLGFFFLRLINLNGILIIWVSSG
jgi:hypothetical protein